MITMYRAGIGFLERTRRIWWMWAIKNYPKIKVTYSVCK